MLCGFVISKKFNLMFFPIYIYIRKHYYKLLQILCVDDFTEWFKDIHTPYNTQTYYERISCLYLHDSHARHVGWVLFEF